MKKHNITITARIIYGQEKWVRVLSHMEWQKPVWDIFPKTSKQLNSEQYLTQLKFVRKMNEGGSMKTKHEFYTRLLKELRWSDIDDIRNVLRQLLGHLLANDTEE